MKFSEKNKDFFERVYQVVALIPFGRITNYGSIAKYLGSPNGARMVGWAMNACHTHRVDLPAHRVVNRLGVLTGKMHFATPTIMQDSLEKEGVIVVKDKIQNFKELYWDPMKELTLE